MKVEQRVWTAAEGWGKSSASTLNGGTDLVLAFGSNFTLPAACGKLRAEYPSAYIIGCSTAGEIHGPRISSDGVSVTALDFEKTRLKSARAQIKGREGSFAAGRALAEELRSDDLAHVLVLSDGLNINGTELTRGLAESLPETVSVTGGLSADDDRFGQTLVMLDDAPTSNMAAAIGFYGRDLKIGFGSVGGWEPFGTERLVTKSRGNVLYELDGRSALELYEKYLGEYATGLPATGLLFPLSIRTDDPTRGLVRTILRIDRNEQSMTFAGDIPEGAYGRLMKASNDRLVQGAGMAADACITGMGMPPQFALLISCVGRRLLLKQRAEEELEAVRDALGAEAALAGFYSYGEIAPLGEGERPELHNQTMTVTGFSET